MAEHLPLSEPRNRQQLRDVLRRRASWEGGHVGRSDLTERQVFAALRTISDDQPPLESESRAARDFLGGNGLITRFGIRDTITAAGRDLLQSEGR